MLPSTQAPVQYNSFPSYTVSGWDPQLQQHQVQLQQHQIQQQIMMQYPYPQHMVNMTSNRGNNHNNHNNMSIYVDNNNRRRNNSNNNNNNNNNNRSNTQQQQHTMPISTESTSINDVRGNVIPLAREQVGCRILQQLLESNDPQIKSLIVEESMEALPELMQDTFGNYLFQKLLENVDENTRLQILTTVQKSIFVASLNLHGTRAIQRTIELCCRKKEEIEIIVSALRQNTVRLSTDQNGNHVLQKCLLHFPAEDYAFIFKAVTMSCLDVCTQRHGCCVVQRCLDASRDGSGYPQGLGRLLVDDIIKHVITLMQVG